MMKRPVFTFDTTHHALWSEELALEAGIAHEVVPAPAAADARCGIGIEVLAGDVERFRALLRSAGVEHGVHEGADD